MSITRMFYKGQLTIPGLPMKADLALPWNEMREGILPKLKYDSVHLHVHVHQLHCSTDGQV